MCLLHKSAEGCHRLTASPGEASEDRKCFLSSEDPQLRDRRADRCKKYAWQSTWEIVWFFHSFFRSATLSASLQAHHPRSFLNPVLWVFRELSSHSHDGSLVIDSTSSSFPRPRGQVVVPKVPIHYLWSFRLASSHYPVFIWELCQNLHKLRSGWNIKTLFPFLSPRKFQELWVLCLKQV